MLLCRRLTHLPIKACLAYSKSREYTLVLTPLPFIRIGNRWPDVYAGTDSSEFVFEEYYVDHTEDDYAEP